MGQILHGSATTTEAVRRAIQNSEESLRVLAVNLGLGLTATTGLMAVVLIGVMVVQLAAKRYVPWAYWLAVVMVSIAGTLITDNLVDTFGVPLTTTTAVFSVALAATFAIWFAVERTLSIHAIFTDRREAFYWLAIFLTFALGTAVGDLVSEYYALGYMATGALFGLIIASLALGYFQLGLDPILGFWLAYILTRPLGASFGDMLAKPVEYGGLGFGTMVTSAGFLAVILSIVVLMTVRRDRTADHASVCASV